jgi:hypothetical protein
VLTQWLSWRWVLFVNVPIGIFIALVAPLFVNESERRPGRFDLGGALTSTLGMTALVYGFIRAAQEGWKDRWTVTSFVAAVVLLAVFVVIERIHPQPVVPLRLFRERNRAGTYLVMLSLAASLMSMFFFLTLFVQDILGYSPLKAGFAFLPIAGTIIVTATICARLLVRYGPKPFLVSGSIFCTAGLIWLSQISAGSDYVNAVLGPTVLFAAGMGFLFVPLTAVAVAGVNNADTGAASGLLNVTQQVGGSLGLSILVTVFGTASRNEGKAQAGQFLAHASALTRQAFAAHRIPLPAAYADKVLAHGIATAFKVGVIFAVVTLIVSVVVISAKATSLAQSKPTGPLTDGTTDGTTEAIAPADGGADAEDGFDQQPEPVLVGAGKHSFASGNGHAHTGIGPHVSGHVRRPDGTPVSGTVLTLIDQSGRQVSRAAGNPDGSYTVGTPGSGTYVLIASAGGHRPQASSVFLDGNPATLDITLSGAGQLTGVVRVAGKGTALSGATVILTDDRGEVVGAAVTPADGGYAFEGVGAGHYTLVASSLLYWPSAVMLTVPDSGVLRHDVELTGSVLLAGTARGEDDRLVPDARIAVLDAEGNVSAVARTDAEGRYAIRDLPEGSYTVVASGYPPATSQVDLSGGTEAIHDVRLGYDQALEALARRS